MGDPKKSRKKYSGPRHPWEKNRIEEEKQLQKEYGFKNKKELWKSTSLLKNIFDRAKKFTSKETEQTMKEKEELILKLKSYALLQDETSLDKILGIQLKDILERRLQTIVFKKKLANSIKQARQFIAHGHIKIENKTITSPSYLVNLKEEGQIYFDETSSLASETHPERTGNQKEKGETI